MGFWNVACTCMGLALGQAAGEPVLTNQRSLQIPVNFHDVQRAELRNIVLYSSSDQGRTWQQAAVIAPTKNFFTFDAQADGTYWLQVAAIDKQGRQDPANIQQREPDLKIVMDTLKPLLRIVSPRREGDEVVLGWDAREDNPDWTSLRLEYQVKDGTAFGWNAVNVQQGPTGQVRFRPSSPETLNVRLSLKDRAGNLGFVTEVVPGTAGNGTRVAGGPLSLPPTTGNPPPPVPARETPPPTFPGPRAEIPPGPPAAPMESLKPVGWTNPNPAPGPVVGIPETNQTLPKDIRPVATTSSVPGPAEVPAAPQTSNRLNLPPVQYVNKKVVPLAYEVTKVGPSGVGKVELWWTRNDGRTWELYAEDPDVKGMRTGRNERTIELPGDGVYGLALIIRNRAGLGKAPPQAGEAPEMRVEIDTTLPAAELFPPSPDRERPGALLLRWTAQDKNLTTAPITLEWAERPTGPWQAIAEALPHTGKHSWVPPQGIPVQVYLRLRVRDLAGNENQAVTAEPQLVDLSEPEGRLIGIVSPARRP